MRRRLLIVEDDPDTALVLTLAFDPGEFQVRVAADLAGARALLAGPESPDLVILDLGLPDGDGVDLCREAKALWPAVPIVVVTARGSIGRLAAQWAGADVTFVKPTNLEVLEREVRRLLGDAPEPERSRRA